MHIAVNLEKIRGFYRLNKMTIFKKYILSFVFAGAFAFYYTPVLADETQEMSKQLLECAVVFDLSKNLSEDEELSEDDSYVFDVVITGFQQRALEFAEKEGKKEPVKYIEVLEAELQTHWEKRFSDFNETTPESIVKSLMRPSTYAFKTIRDMKVIQNKIEECGTLGGPMRIVPM